MKLGNFNGIDNIFISNLAASKYIRKYQKDSAKHKHDSSFNIWSEMYATPYARQLNKDPFKAARAEQMLIRARPHDTGAKAVAEVKKAANELVEIKKQQTKVAEASEKAAKAGDIITAEELAKNEAKIAQKAKIIEGQLASRVDEGVKLAKVKRAGERRKGEVDAKKSSQAKRFPHLISTWAKHDALYDRNRNKLLQKHHVAELKGAELEAHLKTLPSGLEREAKLERHRKEGAARRITQAQEVAKLDDSESGKIDARERVI